MRVGVTMPVDDGLSANDFVQIAVEAEELGYDTVVCGEVAGAEVMATLGMMAARTDRVRLASGIIPTSTRQRFHDLRHAAASSMLAEGVSLRVVTEVLGHSEIDITANIYGHVMPELSKDATDRVGKLL